MQTTGSVRFDVSDVEQRAAMLRYLDENGYAMVAAVASEEQVAQGIDKFWAHIEEKGRGIRRDDPSSWTGFQEMMMRDTGIVGSPHLNHSDFSWFSRTLPKVKAAFAAIWGDEDLVVSYDAMNVFRPWHPDHFARRGEGQSEQAERSAKANAPSPESINVFKWRTNGGWWHVDQNSTLPGYAGRVSVQGFVSYTDSDETTGGLCVIPKSHRLHDALCEKLGQIPINFVSIPDIEEVVQQGPRCLVCCRAGDLVLWDSRLVHCNTPATRLPPIPGRIQLDQSLYYDEGEEAKPEQAGSERGEAKVTSSTDNSSRNLHREQQLLRLVSYVCMIPRARLSEDILYRRKLGYIYNLPSSHWPDQSLSPWSFFNDDDQSPWEMIRSLLAALVGLPSHEAGGLVREDWAKAPAEVLRLVGFTPREVYWRRSLHFPPLPRPTAPKVN